MRAMRGLDTATGGDAAAEATSILVSGTSCCETASDRPRRTTGRHDIVAFASTAISSLLGYTPDSAAGKEKERKGRVFI